MSIHRLNRSSIFVVSVWPSGLNKWGAYRGRVPVCTASQFQVFLRYIDLRSGRWPAASPSPLRRSQSTVDDSKHTHSAKDQFVEVTQVTVSVGITSQHEVQSSPPMFHSPTGKLSVRRLFWPSSDWISLWEDLNFISWLVFSPVYQVCTK